MGTPITIEEEGFLEFSLKDSSGTTLPCRIDVLFAISEFGNIAAKLKETQNLGAYFDTVKSFLVGQGFPESMSLNTVRQVVDRINEENDALVKKSAPESTPTT